MKNHNLSGEALWQAIRDEARAEVAAEPALASFLNLTILRHDSLSRVLAFHLSGKLSNAVSAVLDARALYEIFMQVLRQSPDIVAAAEADILAHFERDPACNALSTPLLYFKGFHALQTHRINHKLWQDGRKTLAYCLQNRMSEVFGVDIHPAAVVGKGIMFDHGTGLVIGETARLGDNISILHGVTLGGSGKESGDRHPKIGNGVMIGANASVLGNIKIGECSRIGAGSVVVKDVPPHCTVVGVPAQIVGTCEQLPAALMNQCL